MTLNWIDKNHDIINAKLYDGCHLVQKLISYKEVEDGNTFAIICTSKNVAKAIIRSFSKLEDSFQSLHIRLGWMDNEGEDVNFDLESLQGSSIIVGEDTHILGFSKVKNENCLFIASKAMTDDKHIGFQRHLARHNNPYSMSLGELKANMSEAETKIRTANSVYFHINAIKRDESGSDLSHTAGLNIYESCQLMRLAGLSTRLCMMYLSTGTDKPSEATSDALSLLIWYYLEGQINIEIETMKQRENDIFLVSSDYLDEPIKFVVGHKTGRWWFQHPTTKEYMPCSDQDYQAISKGKLPDAIMALEC